MRDYSSAYSGLFELLVILGAARYLIRTNFLLTHGRDEVDYGECGNLP